MDIKEIKQIVDLMKRSDLTEFELEEKELKLRICRNGGANGGFTVAPVSVGAPLSPAPAVESLAAPAAPVAAKDEPGVILIKSPMVGSFYRSPTPDSKAFIDVGSKVKPDSVVCIIEAMKVMNEINSEVSGTVVEILVENGQAVEYGQALFKVKA
ncbi:acetyl-CoA carboxylase biotin carboxyl carrier protein [Cerasicoccus arenae]|uniref:Biotin carboxyl carrier protein of acetyl-CoA carboxylase n=1 Tax=Cerasicoccus arenae TaxID=424488 RepID=A0A8J3DBR5_9BACT|nr:acetyl-CoA carboxylase biotin carboxyl carrier protein [Cerasicoccus arenae]MBK1858405.1 acetyl-CoA carboxylase biotin carboxyl carrier protein [Cerasicoccus arenae]GHC02330.1 acetyl-CoA carboxylase, biotin carboxyl carrier protein [Cerasicoccus arenae]